MPDAGKTTATGVSLEVRNVSASYGPVSVLKGISLNIAPGEFVALLGSSGCGKTTLLRAMSGFVNVDGGQILVAGDDITRRPPDKRHMAMVFQSYALWPHMTAAQNIGYGLRLRRVPAPQLRQRVDTMLDMLGLAGLGGRKIGQLSGGQRQRVALGRALAIEPQVLLLDEPLSNLDARIRQTVRHEIKALQEQLGITAVHVTHDREEAMVMADRIVILDTGRIVQVGAPEDVYNRPASPFIAAFMGADNVVTFDAERRDRGIHIPAAEHNDEAFLIADGAAAPDPATGAAIGVHVVGSGDGQVHAHFRSEAAHLVAGNEVMPDSLVLRGQVRQSSYPGGFYRYAVAVGTQNFMVDDPRRLAVGAPVGISLPAASLHLYSADGRGA